MSNSSKAGSQKSRQILTGEASPVISDHTISVIIDDVIRAMPTARMKRLCPQALLLSRAACVPEGWSGVSRPAIPRVSGIKKETSELLSAT